MSACTWKHTHTQWFDGLWSCWKDWKTRYGTKLPKIQNSWVRKPFHLPLPLLSSRGSFYSHRVSYRTGLNLKINQFSSVQSLSLVQLFVTPWITARQASLSISNSRSSLKLMSIESVMPSSHLILRCPLLLLTPIPPSIRVFSNELLLCMKCFSFNIIPSKEHPGLISFRMDWLDLLAVQGTLKSLLQHHSSEASILWRSAFFTVQLSHPYMTTGKTIALTRRTFVGKVMSRLFNILSRMVITFLPRSKCLLISCLQSPSAVILELKKNKFGLCFQCFPIYLPWNDGTRHHDLSFLNVEL